MKLIVNIPAYNEEEKITETIKKIPSKFIGIDLYPSYCTIAKKRCGDAVEYLQENNLDPTKEAR